MDAMTVSNGVNPESKRADGEHQRSEIQRQASEKVSKLSTYLDRLPFEIQAMVAKNLIQREDLKNLSEVSPDWKDVALREINLQNEMVTVKELQILKDLHPSEPAHLSSAVDIYKAFLTIRDPLFGFSMTQIDGNKLEQLQQALTALCTNQVAERTRRLKEECQQEIMRRNSSIESIDEQYSRLKCALVSEALKLIISSSINPVSSKGLAVDLAAKQGHLDVVQSLLADGVELSIRSRGLAALSALGKGHVSVAQFLLANRAQITEIHRNDLVVRASKSGYLDVVQTLIADEARISDLRRGLAVCHAAENGYLAVVQCLLANGARISAPQRGLAVTYAAKRGHLEVVQFLLPNRSLISKQDLNKALDNALQSGHKSIADFLS